jgi:hypothetical protein
MAGGAFDEAIEQFGRRGPEFGPGLSNHGPMAADALVAMGREDAVLPWAQWYVARLEDPSTSGRPIDAVQWREALGDIRRAGDWTAFFARELDAYPWPEVLETWVARLVPGIMAGATHGILRTAHAVRALDRGENPQRVTELAAGLAYWAARYQELPSSRNGASGALGVEDALRDVTLVDRSTPRRGLIFEAVRAVEATDFAGVIDTVDTTISVDAFVSDVTQTFVRQYLANARHASISFVHTVTAPSALRFLAPHLSEATTRSAMRYAWQACASIYATYGGGAVPALDPGAPLDAPDLIDQAVAARDEHAIKFTEACLREHALSGDGAFVVAARDAVVRLRAG